MDSNVIIADIESGDTLALYEHTKGFIAQTAKRFTGKAEKEDLMQEGYIALTEAVKTYNPKSGATFLNWFDYYLRHAFLQVVRQNRAVYIPEGVELEKWRGDNTKCSEQARKFDAIASLDAPTETGDPIGDIIPAPDNGTENRIILQADIRDAINTLPQDQREVINAHYFEGVPLKQLSATKHHRALKRLSRCKQLQGYNEYRGTGVKRFRETWTSATEYRALKLYEKGET